MTDDTGLKRLYYFKEGMGMRLPLFHLEEKVRPRLRVGRILAGLSLFSEENSQVNLREEGEYELRVMRKVHSQDHLLIAAYKMVKQGYVGKNIDVVCLSVILRQEDIEENSLLQFLEENKFSTEPPKINTPGKYRLWIDNVIRPEKLFQIQNDR